jgi:PIN domain nuclease of toxin-antitoxin system
VRFLLDTQVWLWMHLQPERLRPEVRAQFVDPASTLLLSAASSWEIAIKYGLGKLPLPELPYDYVSSRMRRDAVDGLPVTHAHALHVASLPRHHTDPFDRILIAQSQLEDVPLVTADRHMDSYDVAVIPAV